MKQKHTLWVNLAFAAVILVLAGLLLVLAVFFGGVWLAEMATERWPVPMACVGLGMLLWFCWSERGPGR